jgi:hypothetical protein
MHIAAYSIYTTDYAEAAYLEVSGSFSKLKGRLDRIKQVIERTNQGPNFSESLKQLKNTYNNQSQNVLD